MNRRSFLRALGIGTAGLVVAPTLDLDRLLWVPGARSYFFLPGDTLITPGWVTREVASLYFNQLAFVNMVNRHYDDTFVLRDSGLYVRRSGLYVRRPVRWAQHG